MNKKLAENSLLTALVLVFAIAAVSVCKYAFAPPRWFEAESIFSENSTCRIFDRDGADITESFISQNLSHYQKGDTYSLWQSLISSAHYMEKTADSPQNSREITVFQYSREDMSGYFTVFRFTLSEEGQKTEIKDPRVLLSSPVGLSQIDSMTAETAHVTVEMCQRSPSMPLIEKYPTFEWRESARR